MRTFVSILTAMVVLAVSAAGAAAPSAATAGGGQSALASGSAAGSAQASGLTPAGRKALKKCQKIRKIQRRKSCVKRVRKNHTKPRPVTGTTYDIEVRDKYFNPAYIAIKSGDSLLWTWPYVNKDAHNVDLVNAPAGVDRLAYSTPSSPSVGFTFKRQFTVPGTYDFVCSIHHLMGMQVEVTK